MPLLILGLVLFIGLIIAHELGHFWAARRNGVEVEEFGIFFPPTLWRKKTKGGWDFTFNLLPLGGFVKLKGEYDADRRPGAFGAASNWAKAKIMLAGVAVNLVTAILLFTLLALVGMPKLIDNQFTIASDTKTVRQDVYVAAVEDDSPAAKAGLKSRDRIINIKAANSSAIQIGQTELRAATSSLAGKSVTVTYERNGQTKTSTAKLLSESEVKASLETDNPKGYLGVTPAVNVIRRSTWSAPVVALGLTGQFTKMTFQGLGSALKGLGGIIAGAITGNDQARRNAQSDASQVSGPLGIFMLLKSGSSLGIIYTLALIALISLTLAIMNALPIPAMDGGRLFAMLVARAMNKPLTQKVEEIINSAGFFILIALMLVITIVDVRRFF